MNDQTFGERLKILRKRRGMTQTDLAKAMGITVQTVVRYEGLGIEDVKRDRLRAFARALRAEEWELTGEDPDEAEEDIRVLTRGLKDLDPERRKRLIELIMPIVEDYRQAQQREKAYAGMMGQRPEPGDWLPETEEAGPADENGSGEGAGT